MVEDMFDCAIDLDFCEHCMYGKHNGVRFSSSVTRAEGILELVQNDVLRPVPITSLGKCVLCFINR